MTPLRVSLTRGKFIHIPALGLRKVEIKSAFTVFISRLFMKLANAVGVQGRLGFRPKHPNVFLKAPTGCGVSLV